MVKLDCPVLIAGGGPVGMTLALNLARYGVKSILLERNPTTTRHPKMDLTNARSMELFNRLGIAEKLRDAGVPRENAFDILWVTSLAGYPLHRFEYPSANKKTEIIREQNDGSHASQAALRVSQVEIEPVLKREIDENSLITVRFGTAFERIISQDADGVTVEISDSETGEKDTIRCQYLAGCDGGGSRVRRALEIELDGEMEVAGAHMVHFRTEARDVLQRWGPVYHLQSGGGTIIAQNDDDIYTLQAWLIPDAGIEDMRPEDVLEGWAGKQFDYEILEANPWHANFVVAQKYREGRILLAGDAAHQFIPTGGYGMNSGIADAAALSWVLAACVQGWGGDSLLAAYDRERRPTAWWHLEAARRHMDVRQKIAQLYAEAGDLEGSGDEAQEKRAEVAQNIAKLGNAENESWGVEFGYRYDDSPIVISEPSAPAIDPINYRPSTVPGARLPHIFLEDGQSIHDKLGLYFTLIAFEEAEFTELAESAEKLGVPLKVVVIDRSDLTAIFERKFLIVRPDQHIGWRGDELPEDSYSILRRLVGL